MIKRLTKMVTVIVSAKFEGATERNRLSTEMTARQEDLVGSLNEGYEIIDSTPVTTELGSVIVYILQKAEVHTRPPTMI